MPGNSKVAPSTTSSTRLNESENSTNELRHLLNYVNKKKCYGSSVVEQGKIVDRRRKAAFIVEIWTLSEKRSIEWEEKADDDKPAPGDEPGDLFDKYQYKSPDTVISEKQYGNEPLANTRKREICPGCNGKGLKTCHFCSGTGKLRSKDCPICQGCGTPSCTKCSKTGKIIRWAKLKIEWQTNKSEEYYQNTYLPEKLIRDARLKTTVFNGDNECKNQSVNETFPHLIKEVIETSPVDFTEFLIKRFKLGHLDKLNGSMIIRRVKCIIKKVDIMAILYQSGTFTNAHSREGPHVFQFLLYDQDDKEDPQIYEDDYPLSGCGYVRCSRTQSVLCSIS